MNSFAQGIGFVAAVLAVGACTGGDSDPSALDEFGEFRSFEPNTRATASFENLISVTSIEGNIGCGMAQSLDAMPGLPGEQVFVNYSDTSFGCEPGTYAIIASTCRPPEVAPTGTEEGGGDGDGSGDDGSPTFPGETEAYLPANCAVFRSFASDGTLDANVYAVGGAITLSQPFGACRYELDLVFPGGKQFSDAFSLSEGVDCLE